MTRLVCSKDKQQLNITSCPCPGEFLCSNRAGGRGRHAAPIHTISLVEIPTDQRHKVGMGPYPTAVVSRSSSMVCKAICKSERDVSQDFSSSVTNGTTASKIVSNGSSNHEPAANPFPDRAMSMSSGGVRLGGSGVLLLQAAQTLRPTYATA